MVQSEAPQIKPRKFRRGLDLGPPHPVSTQAIEDLPAPPRVFVPLKQHRGALCRPQVSAGETVKIGQVLGESADPEAAPIHAPVSGRVLAVAEHLDPFGRKIPTVTIENDGAETWVEEIAPDPEYLKKKVSVMIRALRRSGVVEARTGRPIHTMLAPPERPRSYIFLVGIPVFKPAELLVVNAVDGEPTLVSNRRLVLEQGAEVGRGLEVVKKIAGVKKAALAVCDDLFLSDETLQVLAGQGVQVVGVKNRYPLAWSEFLITALTGREVPWPEGEPRDVGAVVLEAEAVLGVLEAVRSGRPQIDRVISVTGPGLTPRNFRVRLGTPLAEVVAAAGGSFEGAGKVLVGGLMDGAAQFSDQVPVTKESRGVIVLNRDNLVTFSEHLCIKCGRCVAVCPVRLLPNVITNYCEFGSFAEAAEAELFKCIECGCCAFVCPAKRPLIHYVKHGKAEVTAMRAGR